MPGGLAPTRRSPKSPKNVRSFHSPKTPDESTLGSPLRRTNHLIQQVPTSNEELPRPQDRANDFRQVLRKKHAASAAFG
jgi:hypothetical protein